MGAMTGVALNDISVAFDGVPALQNVSLSVDESEFFTLVGPSGCGKTTLLRTIAGFEEPEAGTVEIGENVAGVPPEDRNVGVVFQDYALFPHMTVRENVAYGLRYRRPPEGVDAEERAENLLDLVDMGDMSDRNPEELSGGQQQRIALARALAPRPNVLLLDEPLSALDARLRERLRVVIRDIQQELSITTIYVTHDQEEALAISDRVAVINDGQVEQVGLPERIYREPATRFVAEFVGDNNLLDGEVVSTDPPRVDVTTRSTNGGKRTGHGKSTGDGETVISVPQLPAGADRVTLSIRPEAITLGNGTAPVALSATVDAAEFMGDAYRVHCAWQGYSLLVRAAASEAPSGAITLGFDPTDVTVLENG